MPMFPDASPDTATYAAQVLAFRVSNVICDITFDIAREGYGSRLSIVDLTGQLEEFLRYAFRADALLRCRISSDVIYIGTTPNIPHREEPARPADALEAIWQALTSFTGLQFPQPNWEGMPRIDLPRGEGIDLGEPGVQMTYMINHICGFTL